MSQQAALPCGTRRVRFLGLPTSGIGWSAVGLSLCFFLFLSVFYALLAAGQKGGTHFFHNPRLAYSLLAAAASAVCAGIVAVAAMIRRRERSIVLVGVLLLAGFVILFGVAEVTVPH